MAAGADFAQNPTRGAAYTVPRNYSLHLETENEGGGCNEDRKMVKGRGLERICF